MYCVYLCLLRKVIPGKAAFPNYAYSFPAFPVRITHSEILINVIFFYDLSFRGSVLAGKSFVHTVFHNISELVELGAVVGNRIIITDSPDFPIVLVEDIDVLSVC